MLNLYEIKTDVRTVQLFAEGPSQAIKIFIDSILEDDEGYLELKVLTPVGQFVDIS